MSEHGIFGEDFIFDPITYKELIVTLHCNEPTIDKRSIGKVLKEIIEHRVLEAFDRIARNGPYIIDEVNLLR